MHEPFLHWGALHVKPHYQRYAQETDPAERKINVEDPAPRGMRDKQAPNQRAGSGTQEPGNLDDTYIDRPLTEWYNVRHDYSAQGEDTATSHSLNCATRQQLIETLGEAAKYTAYCEEAYGDEVKGAAAEDVGKSDYEGLKDRLRQEVGRSSPEGISRIAIQIARYSLALLGLSR